MLSNAAERFRAWCIQSETGGALWRFRFAFTALWLTYDLADLIFHGTASILFGSDAHGLFTLQLLLIGAQFLVLANMGARLACFLCFTLRLAEAKFFFGLNDFYYYCAMMLLLSSVSLEGPGQPAKVWPRSALLAQMAWMYFATALLKLNPDWLSGGHLFVRQAYLAGGQGWPYPGFYTACCLNLGAASALAKLGVLAEFTMAILLTMKRWPRLTLALGFSIHLFAALALNVWFFGASMVLGTYFLLPRSSTEPT